MLALALALAASSGFHDPELFNFLRPAFWVDSPNTDEQYFPSYLGATPRELVLGLPGPAKPQLPPMLKAKGEMQAPKIATALGLADVELEAWPTEDWNGQPNWVYARWRKDAQDSWHWLSAKDDWRGDWPQDTGLMALLPEERSPDQPEDRTALFADFLLLNDLYSHPVFGTCVYTLRATGAVALAWPDPEERLAREAELTTPGKYLAHCMNPPARFGDAPVAFALHVKAGTVQWPDDVTWLATPAARPPEVDQPALLTSWPADFVETYRSDLLQADGEAEARFPVSGRTQRFVKKGSFEVGHDLEAKVDWLEERYAVLGIPTIRQRFTWRGLPQSNLIAVIKGTGGGAPVVMADHIDTACEEDTFASTGKRVTTHGADDNSTATAALLAAAVQLKDKGLRRDVWLVHLTGEEFPSDSLGSRHFISEMLKAKQDLHAVVISDFIGWHQPGSLAFQVSPAAAPGSERLAAAALDAARKLAPEIAAVYQPRDNERNAVFQTDVAEFEYVGYPGLVFNENMNYATSEGTNPNYHQSTDVAANIDFDFATQVTKVLIETVARAANEP